MLNGSYDYYYFMVLPVVPLHLRSSRPEHGMLVMILRSPCRLVQFVLTPHLAREVFSVRAGMFSGAT